MTQSEPKVSEKKYISFRFLYLFCLALMLFGIHLNTPGELLQGMIAITTSPGNLLTDYIAIAGIGPAFFNSGLITFCWVLFIQRMNLAVTGGIFAGLITVAGFSFFGKDLFNSIPIVLGCVLYAKFNKVSPKSVILAMLFGTTLAPAVSFVVFGMGLPLYYGLPIAVLLGIVIGFVIPLTSTHFLTFHQGFNLYNFGFTAGIIGMTIVGIFRMFNVTVELQRDLYTGRDIKPRIALTVFFVFLIILGYFKNGKSFNGYAKLLKESGRLATDYLLLYNDGLVYINMGLCGLISLLYVFVLKAGINGPVLGGIFTVLGFSAFGKHPRNITPLLIGITIANFFSIHDINSTGAILSGLFGTCLAPIAGYYGWGYGILAGFIHAATVNNIGFLHGGLNLYNNGFSGGFVAALLVPIFDQVRKQLKLNRNK